MTSHPALTTFAATLRTSRPALTLPQAYSECRRITRAASKSFSLATRLLPPAKQQAMEALYAFCRISDDLIDNHEQPAAAFQHWLTQNHANLDRTQELVLLAWHDASESYNLPLHLADELLAGVSMDLRIQRYETFEDLWLYCYRVASVVGLLAMRIIGFEGDAEPLAIKLGVALQLTNILRDVGEDARRGRIYLPLEDLERFKVSEDEILAGRMSERFRALMRFQIIRAEDWYRAGWPGVTMLHHDGQFSVATAALVYRGILRQIVANDYDVFGQRAAVPLHEKLLLLPRIHQRLERLRQGDPALGDCLQP